MYTKLVHYKTIFVQSERDREREEEREIERERMRERERYDGYVPC